MRDLFRGGTCTIWSSNDTSMTHFVIFFFSLLTSIFTPLFLLPSLYANQPSFFSYLFPYRLSWAKIVGSIGFYFMSLVGPILFSFSPSLPLFLLLLLLYLFLRARLGQSFIFLLSLPLPLLFPPFKLCWASMASIRLTLPFPLFLFVNII